MWSYVPDVVPLGKSVKVGVVVATPVFPFGATQQWIWAAVLGDVRPLKLKSTRIVCKTVSMVTSAKPVPDDAVGEFSLAAAERTASNVIVTALAPSLAD